MACADCIFWGGENIPGQSGGSYGTCRVSEPTLTAPLVLSPPSGGNRPVARGAWYWTLSTDWCGRLWPQP